MTDVLILGGTGWLSGRVARAWTDAGASVTCLARGGRPAPEGAELIVADRAEPGAYDDVAAREWDEIVEISSIPEHVAAAVDALAERTRHWTYVSSLSVVRDERRGRAPTRALRSASPPGRATSTTTRARRPRPRHPSGARSAIARRSCGPGSSSAPAIPPTGSGTGSARFALAGDEDVLAPDARGPHRAGDRCRRPRPTSSCGAARERLARRRQRDRRLDAARRAALGSRARPPVTPASIVEADDDVARRATTSQHWMGPRSLPLWLPRDMPGFSTRSNAAYRAAGGRLRGLREHARAHPRRRARRGASTANAHRV